MLPAEPLSMESCERLISVLGFVVFAIQVEQTQLFGGGGGGEEERGRLSPAFLPLDRQS